MSEQQTHTPKEGNSPIMQSRRLGTSGLVVSELCLGTMTFGTSCDEPEAFRIMDRSIDAGIDFFDTAEMYPVPPQADLVFETERIIGRWLKDKPREQVILATKVTGPGHGWFKPPVRHGKTCLDPHQIRLAVEGSLQRLGTDYIDLYQTHWPDPDLAYEEVLGTLTELKEEGKIRVAGSSNETAWGTMKAQAASEAHGLVRYDTIQNNFSINNRRFEDALADICRREKISLLPYSPLGGGVLTGKYNGNTRPEDARFTRYMNAGERQQRMAKRFLNEKSVATTEALGPIAEEAGLSVTTLALAWSKQHDYVASTIFGVTTMEQLEENLKAADVTLSPETLKQIDAISQQYPYPMG